MLCCFVCMLVLSTRRSAGVAVVVVLFCVWYARVKHSAVSWGLVHAPAAVLVAAAVDVALFCAWYARTKDASSNKFPYCRRTLARNAMQCFCAANRSLPARQAASASPSGPPHSAEAASTACGSSNCVHPVCPPTPTHSWRHCRIKSLI